MDISPSGVYRVLRRYGLNTRAKRLGLGVGYTTAPAPEACRQPEERHLDVDHPGQLVQVDCFRIGRLQRTKGVVWKYTTIDEDSAYGWAELHFTPFAPALRHASALVGCVARDLKKFGWKLEPLMTDHGGEFRAHAFRDTVCEFGAEQRVIRAGRTQTNG